MSIEDKRDFCEETLLNSAEYRLLMDIKGQFGISKAAVLRYGLLRLGDDLLRKEKMAEQEEFR